ncbi:outer membrane lipoprotein-sorting protein [Kordia sp.]|uniref:outer membrane lipoprotein-sorting protein n=1 Tax=Kordia sp. TaxID=1965332 RepID=UPI0025C3964C|nr:outer membrane lipoprotein-sorting protein [Kordia sp.]MCH2193529.1 outer membrane lipoprotein-sorting protein [Kordia sp.]
MKSFKKSMQHIVLVVSLFLMGSVFAQSPKVIMVKVDSVENFTYNSSIRKFQFTSCRYDLSTGRLRCKNKPRQVIVENIHKDYLVAPKKKDAKSLDMIISPIADKGTNMLVWKKADQDDNDFWLYLPALGKVKRIASSNEGGETGSVFGTEFSIEDVSPRKIKDYTYKLLGENTINKRPVWIVESTPTEARSKKTYYSKVISYIDKERYVILKDELYNRTGKLFKQLVTKKVDRIDGVWIVTKSAMINLLSRRITNYDVLSIDFNLDIDDEFFTQRAMTDFAYREKKMNEYRTSLEAVNSNNK